MFISGLAPISVLNGILGKLSNSTKKKSEIFIFLGLSMFIYIQSLFFCLCSVSNSGDFLFG